MKIKVKFVNYHRESEPAPALAEMPPYAYLAKRYDVEVSDEPDFLFFSDWGAPQHLDPRYARCTKIYYSAESLVPKMWLCHYALSILTAPHPRSYKFPYYKLSMENDGVTHLPPRTEREVDAIARQPRKFCYMLASNPFATERREFARALSAAYKTVDCGGHVDNNIGRIIGAERAEDTAFRRQYKFAIAFENKSVPGYTTEKIYNAHKNGSVPIYWGDPEVGAEFNTKAFINAADFADFGSLIEHVKAVDNDPALYRAYLAAPLFTNGRDNEFIRDERLYGYFDHIFTARRPRLPLLPLTHTFKSAVRRLRRKLRLL